MIYSEFELGYRKACRDLEGWIDNHSFSFGRKDVLKNVKKIIHAFGDDPDTGSKFGGDTVAYDINGITTINENAISAYEESKVEGIKRAFSEIENKKRKR